MPGNKRPSQTHEILKDDFIGNVPVQVFLDKTCFFKLIDMIQSQSGTAQPQSSLYLTDANWLPTLHDVLVDFKGQTPQNVLLIVQNGFSTPIEERALFLAIYDHLLFKKIEQHVAFVQKRRIKSFATMCV